jgi:nitrite reductase/ring-hydroxylating ferredoxin subunit
MAKWVDVLDDDELWDGDMAGVSVGKDRYLVVRSDGTLRAFRDVCPHKGTPLSDGDLAEGVLTCNVHLWEFDVSTGRSINPCGSELTCYPVRVQGGRIEIEIDS